MAKLIWIALVLTFFWRYQFGQWPWASWRKWNPPAGVLRARQLLGLPDGAARAEIIAAHRRLIAQVHPDRGGDARLVHEANAARDLLLARLEPHSRDRR